jgi:hypothetical protein
MSWLITGTQKVNWDPSLITTGLWLDAADASTITESGGAVSQWNDKSGNGRNVTQAISARQPVYTTAGLNSKNVLTFTAANQHFLDLPTISLTDNNTFVASVYQRTAGGVNSIDVGDPISYGHYWFDDNILYSLLRGGVSEFSTHGAASTATGAFINVLARNSTGTQAWRNGSALGTRQQAAATTNGNLTFIGRATSRYHSGDIAEIVIGRFDIDIVNRQKLEGYLAHKWGLVSGLPNDHPYKINPPAP